MALKTARLTINRDLLPQKWDELGIRFERHSVAKIKDGQPPVDMVLLKPAGSLLSEEDAVGPEPRWNCVLCGLHLKSRDGTEVQGQGQLLITGQRLIGMIDGRAPDGSPGSLAASGSIFCFTFNRDDVYQPHVKKHLLTPSDFGLRSKEDQPIAFQLLIYMGMAYVANNKIGYWHDQNMLNALSEEGRRSLLRS
jgi:hypothetical protein